MHPTLKLFSDRRLPRRVTRWQLSAVLGVATVISAGTVLIASPAHADSVGQACGTYHSWTECVSYDYLTGDVVVNALNGYPTQQNNVSVTMSIHNLPYSKVFNFPPGSWRGFSVYSQLPPGVVCASINAVPIVCGSFNLYAASLIGGRRR
jgi:hypothetical protein